MYTQAMTPKGNEHQCDSERAGSDSGPSSFQEHHRRIVGIDPGLAGGIARITWDNTQGKIVGALAFKMPETERDIWDELSALTATAGIAVIEVSASRPGQGVASMFKFGRGYGFLRACLIGQRVPFLEVSPRRWTKEVGLKVGASKADHRQLAQQLFPDQRVTNATVDALLIAYWGALRGKEVDP